MKHRYYVTTWDTNKQTFTPQQGVRKGPYSLWGLRKALRKLREFGYPADKGDCSVFVERDDGGVDDAMRERLRVATARANAETEARDREWEAANAIPSSGVAASGQA